MAKIELGNGDAGNLMLGRSKRLQQPFTQDGDVGGGWIELVQRHLGENVEWRLWNKRFNGGKMKEDGDTLEWWQAGEKGWDKRWRDKHKNVTGMKCGDKMIQLRKHK